MKATNFVHFILLAVALAELGFNEARNRNSARHPRADNLYISERANHLLTIPDADRRQYPRCPTAVAAMQASI